MGLWTKRPSALQHMEGFAWVAMVALLVLLAVVWTSSI
jgi:hypothetical protein